MNRGSYRTVAHRLLTDGRAITGAVVSEARGHRRQTDFGDAAGISERTIRRMEENGATLTQALALAGAELHRGDVQTAAYILSMIGETLPLAPRWTNAPRTGRPDIRWSGGR